MCPPGTVKPLILRSTGICRLAFEWPLKCECERGESTHWGLYLEKGNRRYKRIKMVLPVRISGKDSANNPVNELAHTLDITPNGARLGAIRHVLKAGDKLTLQYRQRRIKFRVVWVRSLAGTSEHQVGLEAIGNTGENWGLELPESDLVDEYQNSASS